MPNQKEHPLSVEGLVDGMEKEYGKPEHPLSVRKYLAAKPIQETLDERQKTYGEFSDVAYISQRIKDAYKVGKSKHHELSDDKLEALDMIANKLGRILNGAPNFKDSWHDIAGYATLVANRL